MTKPIRFALIGAGGIGAYHRAAIESHESTGAARLVAVADPWVERLGAQKAELESRGVRWHADYRDLLREESGVDAVVIATPIPFHFDMAWACIARGLFVHLEKPPVPLMRQLDALLAADAGQTISVGFQMIGSECVQALKQLICDGALGEVKEIRGGGCWPRLDNYYSRASWAGRMRLEGAPVFDGPATNAFAHVIHNIMYLASMERHGFAMPVEVQGELYRARPIESYDTACLRGQFASGIEFSVAVTHATASPVLFRIEVRGAKGWARLSDDGAKLESSVGVACEYAQSTQQLLDIDHGNFIDVLVGRRPRFVTRLADTGGYVSATNAMLLSSGGVRDIDAACVSRYRQDGQEGFDVHGLQAAVEDTIATGRLFSEQGLRWASRPEIVRLPLGQAVSLAGLT